jgi:phospholipid/cholesterol/gamma-HCH transport system permease protein
LRVIWIDRVGGAVVGLVRYLLLLIGLLYLSIKVLWTDRGLGKRDFRRQVMLQIFFTGVQAAGPVIVLALAVGAFAVVEGVGGVGAISGAESLGRMVTLVVLREVAPLLTGGVVIVRSVTAIAAELGVMRVQNEIEALEVMGISPVRQLITPRVFGGLISLFVLNVLFDVVALVGGFLIGSLLVTIPADLYFGSVISAVEPTDLVVFATKVLLGGLGIFLIACYHGMNVGRSSSEVPIAVSRAALNSLVFLVVTHALTSVSAVLHSTAAQFIGGVF